MNLKYVDVASARQDSVTQVEYQVSMHVFDNTELHCRVQHNVELRVARNKLLTD